MKNNEPWKTIGISALISIVVFFLLAQFFGAPLFGPPTGTTKEINANRCQADGACETRALLVTDDALFQDTAMFDLDTRFDGPVFVNNDLTLSPGAIECGVVTYTSGNGINVCQNASYDFCVAAAREKTESYYNSVYGSCNGSIQAKHKYEILVDCPTDGGSGGGGCGMNNQGVEPYYGDISSGTGDIKRLLCCR